MANHRRDVERERHWRGVLERYEASGLSVRASQHAMRSRRRSYLIASRFAPWDEQTGLTAWQTAFDSRSVLRQPADSKQVACSVRCVR
jgi:hypothetical protein